MRMLIMNFFELFREHFDERMIDLAVLILTNLEMKRPVDDILWQGLGFARDERLYVLGKLVGFGYLWLQMAQGRVYAIRSYITDDIFKRVDREATKVSE
jgi:hypothetical protein